METDVAGQEGPGFDRTVAELQNEISNQEAALYSARVLAEAQHPRNQGAMLKPDGYAILNGPCGDRMEVFVRLDGPRIQMATFMTDGCGPTVACGSMLTTMAQGKTLDQAAAIRAVDLVAALDGLPPEHVHCASLAVNTLRLAIFGCQQQSQSAEVQ
jgi:nitrogen fixation NifU-like protein